MSALVIKHKKEVFERKTKQKKRIENRKKGLFLILALALKGKKKLYIILLS